MKENKKLMIVVLAAGHGKRMQSELPKALMPLYGKPMIVHLLESIKKSGLCARPVIVVGQKRELVMQTLGDEYDYVIQEEQLGTGHAVLSTAPELEGRCENIMVLYGDMPFITSETLQNIYNLHVSSGADMTTGTVVLKDFDGWRKAFYYFGRVVRDENGKLIKIIEGRHASPEELEITEVFPSYSCYKSDWLWSRLRAIKNENSQKEYYLTDLVGVAIGEGAKLQTVEIPPKEALGANSKEELEILEKLDV